MLCCGHNSYTFAYQPESGLWTHKPQPDPMRRDNFYTLTLCATPEGAYAWTLFGTLFHYNSQKADWEPVETSGEPLPKTACDKSSLVYDAKRNRLLLVHEALKGELIAVNLKTKVATRLTPENMETAAEGKLFWRETTYDVANDLLIVAMRPKDGPMVVYDCAANRWFTHETANRPVMDVSTGLMYDASRQLILTVNANSEVFALKLKR
jgi:hypothetical protein